jgi:hypothetical protein
MKSKKIDKETGEIEEIEIPNSDMIETVVDLGNPRQNAVWKFNDKRMLGYAGKTKVTITASVHGVEISGHLPSMDLVLIERFSEALHEAWAHHEIQKAAYDDANAELARHQKEGWVNWITPGHEEGR